MSAETLRQELAAKESNAASRSVVDMGHRQSVCVKQLIRETVGDLDAQALQSETRTVQEYGGAMYANLTKWALDWHGIEAGTEVRVRTFPDAIVITREENDA